MTERHAKAVAALDARGLTVEQVGALISLASGGRVATVIGLTGPELDTLASLVAGLGDTTHFVPHPSGLRVIIGTPLPLWGEDGDAA